MGEPTDYKVPPPETVQELAKLARCAFTLETREDGSEYWTHNRCAPEWIGELCNTAHGDMLPDDYRYRFIVQALDALEEAEDVDEAGQDWEYEYRYYRVATTATQLQIGHLYERQEVLNLVRGSLEEQLQAMAAA